MKGEKRLGKRGVLGILLIGIMVVSISFVSASWKEWFTFGNDNSDLEGELSETAVAKLKISDTSAPDVVYVSNLTGPLDVVPNLVKLRSRTGGDTLVSFWFLAQQGSAHNDIGALSNPINFSQVNLTRTGELGRNASCTGLGRVSCGSFCTGFAANYSCTVAMRYYDGNGTWNVNASVRAPDTPWGFNTTKTFNVDATFAASALTPYLNWTDNPLSSSSVNVFSDNNITIENNGNVPYPNVQVNATDLNGTITPSEYIPSSRFVANNCTGTTASSNLTRDSLINVSQFIAARATSDTGKNSGLPFCVTSLSAGPTPLGNQEYLSARQWVLRLN